MTSHKLDKLAIFILTLFATFLWTMVGLSLSQNKAGAAVFGTMLATVATGTLFAGLFADE